MVGATRFIRNKLIHKDMNIPEISEHIAKLNISFFNNARKNPEFNEILSYEILKADAHIRPYATLCLSDAILTRTFQA